MANTATNVSTGKPNISGAVFVAPLGTTLPTDATTPLDSSKYVCLGHVSEDGLTNNSEMEVSEIKAWGGDVVYRSQSGQDDTFQLTLIESENTDVLKAVYGDSNVTVDASGNAHIVVAAGDPQERVWVFELSLRNGRSKRIVIGDGAITAREAIVYNDTDAIGYGITVSAYPIEVGGKTMTHEEILEGPTLSA